MIDTLSNFTSDGLKAELEARGYTTVKTASYRRSQERQRMAEVRLECEVENYVSVERWANKAFDEQRRLSDRLTFVYGVAMAHGATTEELAGATGFIEATS